MKRSEALIYAPALAAVLIAVASIAGFESGSQAPASYQSPESVVPAPTSDVPLIGEMTVTGTRAGTDLIAIARASST